MAFGDSATRVRSGRYAPRIIGPGTSRTSRPPGPSTTQPAAASTGTPPTLWPPHIAGAAGNPRQLAAAPLAVRAASQTAPRPPTPPPAAAATHRYSTANTYRLMLRWHVPIVTAGSHAQPRRRGAYGGLGPAVPVPVSPLGTPSSCSSHQSVPSSSSGQYRPAQRRTGRWPGPFSGLGPGLPNRPGYRPGCVRAQWHGPGRDCGWHR
jgi:hypothetical protein